MELRRRAYNKAIANIDKILLNNTDNYVTCSQGGEQVPQSQI